MESERRRFLELARLVPAGIVLAGLLLAARAATGDGGRLKIGIVGSGRVGGTLGTVWAKAGHQVMLSSRDIGHDRELAARIGPNARAGTPREAAAFGDVVTVSVPYRALPDVGRDLADLIRGKTVIDTCNPFVGRDGEIAKWAREKGAGLASAELLAGARIVRAFNAIGYARMGAARRLRPMRARWRRAPRRPWWPARLHCGRPEPGPAGSRRRARRKARPSTGSSSRARPSRAPLPWRRPRASFPRAPGAGGRCARHRGFPHGTGGDAGRGDPGGSRRPQEAGERACRGEPWNDEWWRVAWRVAWRSRAWSTGCILSTGDDSSTTERKFDPRSKKGVVRR